MKKYIIYIVLSLTIILSLPAGGLQAIEGRSPFEPAPPGVKISGIIECGRGYTSHELYNINVTLLEVIRGDNAWKILRETSNANKTPDQDLEYILARVRFEYFARGKPGQCVHKLTPKQFIACSSEGVEYPDANVILPKPKMEDDMSSGDSIEGWIALIVPMTDKKPLLFYSADPGKAVHHGGNIWFKLY